MSQSKTVIQGLDADETNFGNSKGSNNSSLYSRSNQTSVEKGTYVPGMNKPQERKQEDPEASAPTRKFVGTGKPIVGFLYSISRTAAGEFWPLSVGRNTIGSKAGVDIQLSEGTVSSEHAVLVIRQMKNTGNIIAAITDSMSTNGTMINGETIGFTATECHDGDVITIGSNYELYLVLIDSAKACLSVSKEFIATEESEEDFDIPGFDPNSTRPGGFSPFDRESAWNAGGFNPSAGTVGMDGSVSGNNHGGTVSM